MNVKSGTQIIWVAQDAQGRSGGTSDLLTVLASGSSSCIDSNSPGSTATPTPSPNGDHTSAILGGALGGGLAAILIAGGFLFLWLKKRRRRDVPYKAEVDSNSIGGGLDATPFTAGIIGNRASQRSHVRPMPNDGDQTPSPFATGPGEGNLEPNPFVFPATVDTTEPTESRTRRSSKSALMSTPRTPRFVLHTDAEDAEEEEEVVELPPQYRPARASHKPLQIETTSGDSQPTNHPISLVNEAGPSYPPPGHAI